MPAHDPLLQWPEGVDPSRTLCLVLERAAGTSYRLLAPAFGNPPPHVWCASFPHVVSSIGVVAAFVAGAAVWGSAGAGVLAAAFYAFSLATTARSIGSFGHEDMALPFLFLGAALLFRPTVLRGAAAAACLTVALGSWHFARFAVLLLATGLAFRLVTARGEARRASGLALLWTGAGVVAAVALFEVLRAGVAAEGAAYGHVYALFLDKLRFLVHKPADPSLLSADARSLWIEDFASPSPYLAIALFGVPAAFAAVAFVRARGDHRESLVLLLTLVVLSSVSFLLVKRLFVLLAFFLAVGAGGAWGWARDAGHRRWRLVPALVLLAALAFEAHKVTRPGGSNAAMEALRDLLTGDEPPSIPNWQVNDLALLNWIRHFTDPGDPFVARIGTSAAILAYAERPVVLHPKFEVPGMRERSQSFDAALYSTEGELARFCREHRARYLVYEPRLALDAGSDSKRYVACATELSTSSAVVRLHFAAEESEWFRPVYRNLSYAVFEVRQEPGVVVEDWPDVGGPVYDIATFGQTLDEAVFRDRATAGVLADVDRAVALFGRGQAELAAGRWDAARRSFEEARSVYPGLVGLDTSLGLSLARLGDWEGALPYCEREARNSPQLALAHMNLGFVEANLGRWDDARRDLLRAIVLEPTDPGPRAMLAQVDAVLRGRQAAGP